MQTYTFQVFQKKGKISNFDKENTRKQVLSLSKAARSSLATLQTRSSAADVARIGESFEHHRLRHRLRDEPLLLLHEPFARFHSRACGCSIVFPSSTSFVLEIIIKQYSRDIVLSRDSRMLMIFRIHFLECSFDYVKWGRQLPLKWPSSGWVGWK